MAKGKKGKLRTALANHAARTQQRAAERRRADAAEASHKHKAVSLRSGARDARSTRRPLRTVEPFACDDTILLVGEGNFSFALSLLRAPRSHPPHLLLATSFDEEEEVYGKYPDAQDNIAQIRALAGANAATVLAFGVDAGALQKSDAVMGRQMREPGSAQRWSKVWFGFPHVGAGHKDEQRNVLANQLLLLRFFVSVAPLLTRGPVPAYAAPKQVRADSDDDDDDDAEDDASPGAAHIAPDRTLPSTRAPAPLSPPARQGSILVTLRNALPYTLWNVPMLAKKLRQVLPSIAASAPSLPRGMHAPKLAEIDRNHASYTLWRSFQFLPQQWDGYSHRRTVGFVAGRSTENNEDLDRRPAQDAKRPGAASGRHVGTGECRTWEFALSRAV
ncbi:25S rRNA (uracil(2634)-N(3))-methyltransferase [Malassezia sp. CBS 17886]|nr:25S rRNA (uracil(2634)-N(3))-methyltransferase [Malassezia sp. CBS 17886]